MRFVLSIFLIFFYEVSSLSKLQEQYYWKALDFAYPSEQARLKAIQTKRFIPENNLPVGIEVWNDKLFVTVPRWKSGKNIIYMFFI